MPTINRKFLIILMLFASLPILIACGSEPDKEGVHTIKQGNVEFTRNTD